MRNHFEIITDATSHLYKLRELYPSGGELVEEAQQLSQDIDDLVRFKHTIESVDRFLGEIHIDDFDEISGQVRYMIKQGIGNSLSD